MEDTDTCEIVVVGRVEVCHQVEGNNLTWKFIDTSEIVWVGRVEIGDQVKRIGCAKEGLGAIQVVNSTGSGL